MIFFVMTPWMWISIAAAFCAGISGLIANAATRTLLSRAAGPERVAAVMAVWAIAWAGSKPFASLTDGLLAGWLGLRWTGVILAIPALIPIVVLLFAPGLGHRLATFRREKQDPEAAPSDLETATPPSARPQALRLDPSLPGSARHSSANRVVLLTLRHEGDRRRGA
jgi:MFS family permease